MVVYGALLDENNLSKSSKRVQGIAYYPRADRWRLLPAFPLSPQASSTAWTGSELLAWDYELHAGAYDPATDSWRALPDLPLRAAECRPQSARVGATILA